jgi:glutaredoxin
MKIQFLYFDGCPNHERAYKLLQEILAEKHIDAAVERIEIKDDDDAVRHQFIGSPTIRIDGVDVDTVTGDRPYAKTCRIYVVDGKLTGLPSRMMIENLLCAAENARFGKGCC